MPTKSFPIGHTAKVYDGCDLGSDFKGKYVALEDYQAALKDAERYRWLKENYDLAVGENPASMPIDDALIDAAIIETGETNA